MLDSRGGADAGGTSNAPVGAPAQSGAPSGFENQQAQPNAGNAAVADSAPTLSDDTDFEDDIPF